MRPDLSEYIVFNTGDRMPFCHFYDYHYYSLLKYAYDILQNREDARDIVADSFFSVAKSGRIFNNLDHLRSYLYKVARYRCYDHIARQKIFIATTALNDQIPADPFIPEIESYSALFGYATADILQALDPQPREVFIKYYLQDITYKEIAKELNMKEETVRKNASRAIKILRKILKPRLQTMYPSKPIPK